MEKTIDLLNRLITKGQQVVDEAKIIRDDLLKLHEWKKPIRDYSNKIQEFENTVNATEWYPSNILKQFKDYWLEKDSKWKPRFLGEKYFDINRRINNRASRAWVKREIKEIPKLNPKIEITQEQKQANLAKLRQMKANLQSKII